MCRRNQLTGCAMIAFGIGLLLGECITSSFLCVIGGMGLMGLGFIILRQR